tara:strand:- start:31460 stop:31726 length:267 start_codon:yes stop_codon:yes gene_type:complete
MAYVQKDRTLRERQRRAICDALESAYPATLSSRQLQDRLYDSLKHQTPSTTAIGLMLRLLTTEGWVLSNRTLAISPTFSYSWNPEGSE